MTSGTQSASRSATRGIEDTWTLAGASAGGRWFHVGMQVPPTQTSAVWQALSSLQLTSARSPQVNSGCGANSAGGGMYWQLGSARLGTHSSRSTSHTKPGSQTSWKGLVAQFCGSQGPSGCTHSPR